MPENRRHFGSFAAWLLVVTLPLALSCAGRREPTGPPVATRQRQEGLASWYGRPFHGRLTANGEVYDMHGLTAAHRTLPFGTLVEVVNLDNGRRVRVRINDRGPFRKGRIIDLSYAAARHLRMIGPGVVRVRLVVLGKPSKRAG